eukprot:EG_transcript_11
MAGADRPQTFAAPRALEPKVFVPFKTQPGKVSRQVELSRACHTYEETSLEASLAHAGIDYTLVDVGGSIPAVPKGNDFSSYLPLEAFDDVEYDERTPADWLALGRDEFGDFHGVPALALRIEDAGHQKWLPCLVSDWNEEGLALCVQWEDSKKKAWLPRIHVCFKAENPKVFAQRVASAHDRRKKTEALLRYNLFVDSMPIQDGEYFDERRTGRIRDLSINTRKLLENEEMLDIPSVMSEINHDFARTMNKIIFDNSLAEQRGHHEVFARLRLPPQQPPPPVPEFGQVQIPDHSFVNVCNAFDVATYLGQQEVNFALQKVRDECNEVLNTRIFVLPPAIHASTPMTLSEFEEIQTTAINQLAMSLREQWSADLKNGIHEALRDTHEGCDVNIHERVREAYEKSKLKRLMVTVRCMMEDTIYSLVTSSAQQYVDFIEDMCAYKVSVHDLSRVEVEEVQAAPPPDTHTGEELGHEKKKAEKKGKRPPLFKVQLVDEADRFEYSTSPDLFVTSAVNVLDKAITSHQTIPTLESQVMDQFFFNTVATIDSVNHLPMADGWRTRVRDAMSAATEPLQHYLDTYHVFSELLALDVEAYLKEFEAAKVTVKAMEAEAVKHQEKREEVLRRIPKMMNVGTFLVDCSEFRKRLADKCTLLAQRVLELIAKAARERANEVSDAFAKISAKAKMPPPDIESLVAKREYLKTIPEETYDLCQAIEKLQDYYGVLESFQFSLSDDDFDKRWKCIGWPKKLEETVQHEEEALDKDRERFHENMVADQEVFSKEVDRLAKIVAGFHKRTDIKKVADVASETRALNAQLLECREKATLFNQREGLFEKDKTDYVLLTNVLKDFEPYFALWTTAHDWLTWYKSWMNDPFETLDPQVMEQDVTNAWKTMYKSVRVFKDRPLILKIAEDIKSQIDEFKPIMPTVKCLRNEGMRERHWQQLSKELGMEVKLGVTLVTLQDVYGMELSSHQEVISKVSEVAGKEHGIEKGLDQMKLDWKDMKFDIQPYKYDGVFIMKGADEVQQLLDDHQTLTQGLQFSPFKKIFEQQIDEWDGHLRLMNKILEEWLAVQKNWLYLEPIFQSEDIMRQLPSEAKRFATVNKIWRTLLGVAHENPYAYPFMTTTEKCLEQFSEANVLLEKVQKGLNDYLENKRSSFARFYFLSDDELLQILSQAKEPAKIVGHHIRKLIEGIDHIDINEDGEFVNMVSGMGEVIDFKEAMLPRKNVENWLGDIETMMRRTIRQQIENGLQECQNHTRREFVMKFPGQIVVVASQTFWTRGCEKALMEEGSIKSYVPEVNKQLFEVIEVVRGQVPKRVRVNLSSLITIEVHARDLVEQLAESGCSSITEFDWVGQMRYYWTDDDLYVRQVEAQFLYGGEYLGNSGRLVVTPLTDRIYLTLTGAMQMFLGSAPAGPAGTGKTETVKDLAKSLAKQCVVFNCQEGMDFKSMGKMFKGLASAGAWACFDEFNRIDVEVLSVVAQQVSMLQEACKSKQYRINFEGTEIVVDPTHSEFITMNPGYAGRTELPDNLKALFRPVACMVPDYAMIGEIRLFSFGYANSRQLAQKMVATFRLSSEQLSSQDHYDFGMRAVNTVISAAGLMKRDFPDEPEDVLLLRALRDSNVPKFLKDDIDLFNGITSDLFPKVVLPVVDLGELMSTLKEELVGPMKLQEVDEFLLKCIQLYDITILRHGLMLVGPTGGGKTSNYNCLKRAQTTLHQRGHKKFSEQWTYICNPKSITMGQLYGQFDEATYEWTDGILAELFRQAAYDTSPARKWVIFDGPVDALWIESMNTVLDENRKLCLVSGEIITMTGYMNIVFEVEDLAVASPATVSRCGMIYLDPHTTVPTEALVKSFLQHVVPSTWNEQLEAIETMYTNFMRPSLGFLRHHMTEYVGTVNNNLTQSHFNIYSGFFGPFYPTRTYEVPKDKLDMIPIISTPLFFFSLVWSVGATCDVAGRKKFDKWLRAEMKKHQVTTEFPFDGLVFDYTYSMETWKWVPWLDTVPPQTLTVTGETIFSELIVVTTDVVRYKWLINHLTVKDHHVLCVGPTGTGKTLVVNDKLMNGLEETFMPIFFTFSAQTTANQTQDLIFSKFDRRRKGIYGPPTGRKFIVFIDDFNMPQREQYGAQPPIELVRQFMDHKGWYDRKTREFFEIQDVTIIGAMGPPGGGRNPVTNRLLRHFNFLAYPTIDDDNMHRIFSSILEAFLKTEFAAELQGLAATLVTSAIDMYNVIQQELLPTPSKSHYTFNLRDLAKVMQGLLSANPKCVRTKTDFLRLFTHESTRVFRDRLVDDTDRQWFDDLTMKQLTKQFQVKWSEVIGSSERLIYGDFMSPGADARVYDEVSNFQAMQRVMQQYLDDYNDATSKKMQLVMFIDAIEHTARIARIIRNPGGHALNLGVGGSGRQSLTRLAAFICEYTMEQVEILKGYGTQQWRDDLKRVLRACGLEQRGTVFLFTDTQIVKESFLEDVASILNSGEVPNLFEAPDMEEIMSKMKPVCVAEGLPLTKVSLYARFLRFVRANIHVSLCMSPQGEVFRNRLRMFPALVNCCTIDWFSAWPEQALHAVANSILDRMALGPDILRFKEEIVTMCTFMHQAVEAQSKRFLDSLGRYNYVTPTSYLELLNIMDKLLGEKKSEIQKTKQRLSNGLEKLRETEVSVAQLQQSLEKSRPVLVQTAKNIEVLMQKIEVDTAAATETRKATAVEEAAATAKAAECQRIKDEAEAILAKALPELEDSLKVLSTLNVAQISEVARYAAPPGGVKLTMMGVCIMLGIGPAMVGEVGKKQPDYWPKAKALLQNPSGLLDSLIKFDRDNIPEKTIQKIEPLIKSEDFTPEKVKTSSFACAAMCSWCHAMHKYHYVALDVAPKRAMLEKAEAELAVVTERLNEARAKLKGVEDKLNDLAEKQRTSEAKRESLQKEVAMTEVKLGRAGRLIDGLAGEKFSWMRTVGELENSERHLLGDVIVASAQVAYLGAFNGEYRQGLLQQWAQQLDHLKLLHSSQLSVYYTLGNPITMRSWSINGLPSDNLSMENGIILTKARRWGLMIDPQAQANRWIRTMYKDNLDIVKPSNKDLIRRVEAGIRAGRAVLLENVGEEIDPSLDPLILQQKFMSGGQLMIKVGDNPLPWNDDFKFFMTTKLQNPHYTPEMQVKVTVLNFFITPSGLEDQLLGTLVAKERPDLEQMKNQLVTSNADMRRELKEIQDKILQMLEDVKGDVLDDEALIEYLGQSKVKSKEINEKVAEGEITEKSIDETREVYRPVARHGSILFFVTATLSLIDPMYQYSLQWFINLFSRGIDDAEEDEDVAKRLEHLEAYITALLYQNICRSLFEAHKLLFSFLLTIRIMQGAEKVDALEWRYLLAGGGSSETQSMPNPAAEWLTDQTWGEMCYISKNLPVFKGLEAHVAEHLPHYRAFFMSASAHREPFAGEWEARLTPLQRMIFLRSLRPDKLMESVQDFVVAEMGRQFIEPPPFDLATSYKDSAPVTPLIFVLSPGADPFEELLKFADTMRMSKRLQFISLGQGQGPKSERMMKDGMENGTWVLLQNCHLAKSWMPTLERLVENFPESINPSFRLWLTSSPSPYFPVSILQNGVKMTNEPPKGLRANVTRSLLSYPPDFLERSKKPLPFKKLMFALCFFHALIQERRKFGALGWNIAYEFNSGDLQFCVRQLMAFLDKYDEVPYTVIKFLTGQINYGGRVTDDWDRRTLMTILDGFITPQAMDDAYTFSPSGVYSSIPATDQAGYLEYIQTWPINAEPEAFGLHENAEITYARNETYATLATILSVEPRSSSAGGKNRDEVIEDLARDIDQRIRQPFDTEAVFAKYPTKYDESLNTVLFQEAIRFNKLIREIHNSLALLQNALKGLVVMSQQLDMVATALYNNCIPDAWADKAYPSLKPLSSWVIDLMARTDALEAWYQRDPATQGNPPIFWISGFYFPQAFLTGTLQNFARKKQISIDTISFNFKYVQTPWKQITAPPEDGVYIYGMFLDGARWDDDQQILAESHPKQLFADLPVVWLKPEVDRKRPTSGLYISPCYKTLRRAGTLSTTGHSTNFVMTMEVPTDKDGSHWIKRGLAVMLALNY